ncbi:CD209 antigen-like [Eriocheir sinensis]|uniref:Lectin n=1 Tax=Eriocheir sinensis TaxID=95602 RepID=D2T086_ERISI|nr:CD209 antigen-like [Eriocheir sinensis]ADB10837.1 lectin [Eriocheir sinensis]
MTRIACVLMVAVAGLSAASACHSPYKRVGGGCFYFSGNIKRNWFGARDYCKSLEQGGSLAIVDDCSLMRPLWNHILFTYGKSSHWLGASDMHHEGSWTWVDGSPVAMGMPFWSFNEPNNDGQEHCLEFWSAGNGYFNDGQCSRVESFICQAPRSKNSWSR